MSTKDAGFHDVILITASEAYPAFERAVLGAEREITMGFRVFDPLTRLHSAEARTVGRTWADLIEHVLNRGVDITLILSDFDPVAATDLHRATWKTMRILCGIRELTHAGAGQLTVRPMLHPARVGVLPRLLFAPFVSAKIGKLRRGYDALGKGKRKSALNKVPGVKYVLKHLNGFSVPSYPVSHHQKLAVIDGRYLYIGGLDLDERRFDDHDHEQAADQTWHDVQLLLDDPDRAVAARGHLMRMADVVAGEADPEPTPGILRTLSQARHKSQFWHMSPRTVVNDIEATYHARIRDAQNLIYIETQFFRDRAMAQELCDRARTCPDLRLFLVLPAAPESVAFRDDPALDGRYGDHLQTKCLRKLRRAFGDRLLITSPVQRRAASATRTPGARATLSGAPVIYVHAKVAVFDQTAAIVSSANLNGRSLRWDTEAGVEIDQPDQARVLRDRLLRHWMGDLGDVGSDTSVWFNKTAEMIRAEATHAPSTRSTLLVPHDIAAGAQTAVPVPGMPPEMV